MVRRPLSFGAFEFSVLAGLRAVQLARGCTPRVDGIHKTAVMAQMEIASLKVTHASVPPVPVP